MKIFQNILSRAGYEKRSGTANPAKWLIDWVCGGEDSATGVHVTEDSAMKYTPFWSAVRVISGTLAALPFIVYKRSGKGKDRAMEHPVYKLIHTRPNEFMDALSFMETRQAQVLTFGNSYAEIQRNGAGKPIALWPLLPDKTSRKMSKQGVPYYEVKQNAGETVELPDYNVLHIKGLGFDGYTGYNVVAYHKAAIGYGIGVKQYGARFFGNNANPGGVLEHPEVLGDEALKHLKESWNNRHKGLDNAHRLEILEEGMKWHEVGVSPEQAQALEVQKYTVDDCSRIFNIPPHKIGSMDRATFSNIEEQNIDFVNQTMLYWFKKWEQECNFKLFTPAEQKVLFCEILADGLLRGNTKARYEAYNIGRNAGFLSVNDIREKENMNGIGEDGDIYLEPLNMKPAGSEPEPVVEPMPDDEPDDDVRFAHRDMLTTQILRVMRKKYTGDKAKREFANTILYEPAMAYASLINGNVNVTECLRGVIEDIINERFGESSAFLAADRILDKIGAYNG